MFSNFRCARRMNHPGNCSPAPSPVGFNRPSISQSPLLRFSCANPASLFAQDHLFSKLHHLIVFESLLIEFSRANPPTPIAPDRLFSKLHSLPSSTVKRHCRDSRDGSAEQSRRHCVTPLVSTGSAQVAEFADSESATAVRSHRAGDISTSQLYSGSSSESFVPG